jgi:hypothetical protein
VNAICLLVSGVVRATLPADEFTVDWEHSVEKTRWEETYRIDGDRLRLTGARIQGFGAGMEPPQGAILRGGWWTWTPAVEPIAALRLTQSTYTSDWTLCWKNGCRTLGALVPSAAEGSVVDLVACEASACFETGYPVSLVDGDIDRCRRSAPVARLSKPVGRDGQQ